MAFSDAQGFLSEDVLRSMLMEQMRNERMSKGMDAANQGLQAGITGGLQMQQQQNQAEEQKRQWEAENTRAQSSHDQELADLRAAAGLREQQEGERRTRMAAPAVGARAERLAGEGLNEGIAGIGKPQAGNALGFFDTPDKSTYDQNAILDQELQGLADEMGVDINTARGILDEEQRKRKFETEDRARDLDRHNKELEGLDADIRAKDARSGLNDRTDPQAPKMTGIIGPNGKPLGVGAYQRQGPTSVTYNSGRGRSGGGNRNDQGYDRVKTQFLESQKRLRTTLEQMSRTERDAMDLLKKRNAGVPMDAADGRLVEAYEEVLRTKEAFDNYGQPQQRAAAPGGQPARPRGPSPAEQVQSRLPLFSTPEQREAATPAPPPPDPMARFAPTGSPMDSAGGYGGGRQGGASSMSPQEAKAIISSWPEARRRQAISMIRQMQGSEAQDHMMIQLAGGG